MAGVYFILPTVLVLIASFLIVRAGAIALVMTGLDEGTAKFQALSAFTMTGFTTRESEFIVNDPRRRQIISWLMRLGSGGTVVVIVTATTSLIRSQVHEIPISLFILAAGVFTVYQLLNHTRLGRNWESLVRGVLHRSDLFYLGPLETVARLDHEFGLSRIFVGPDSPFIGRSSQESGFHNQETAVLGIERQGQWIPLPEGTDTMQEGDKLLLFGKLVYLRACLRTTGLAPKTSAGS